MKNQILLQNIQSKIIFTEEEFDSLSSLFEKKSVKKNQKLIDEGKTNDKLYFIERGIVYSQKNLDDGTIQVIQFAKENYWITDLCSFFSNSVALFSVVAIEDCDLLYISRSQYDDLCSKNKKFETYFRLTIQSAYTHTLQRLSDVYSEDAESKYHNFINQHFDVSQRVPQYLIASYLGILPSSLSRIRNKKLKK